MFTLSVNIANGRRLLVRKTLCKDQILLQLQESGMTVPPPKALPLIHTHVNAAMSFCIGAGTCLMAADGFDCQC